MLTFSAAAAALVLLLPAAAATSGTHGFELQPPSLPAVQSADDLDAAIDALRRYNWQLYEDIELLPAAPVGAEAREVAPLLLSAQHLERLKQLQRKAHASASSAQAGAVLAEARELIGHEAYLVSILEMHLYVAQVLQAHTQRIEALLAQLPPEARPQRLAPLEGALGPLKQALREGMQAEGSAAQSAAGAHLTHAYSDAVNVYNVVRGQLASELDASQHAQGATLKLHPSERPCPAAVNRNAETSGGVSPALALENKGLQSFYPQTSRDAQFEGSVMLEAHVAANGCLEEVAVYESSGVPELDTAAIAWAQQASFRPAEKDRKAVAGALRFRIKFSLH